MTVLGPIAPQDLGVTLMHEHLLIDLTCIWHPARFDWQEPLIDLSPTLHNRGDLSLDPYVSRPNLRLDSVEDAVEELAPYRQAGGGSVVDLTVQGIDPRPEALAAIARSAGINVVMGCGYYVRRAHPPALAGLDETALAEHLIEEIAEGVGDTAIRPGIIGEIGTSSPIHEVEGKVLRAAVRAQRVTGLAINVHVSIFAREAIRVLDVLERAGADLTRVVISHLDEMLDPIYHRAVLRRGAYVEFDTFGSEFYFGEEVREPSDAERIDALLGLLHEGWADQLLLSQDVCTKIQLRRYGGHGYSHILRTIVPRLTCRGVDDDTIRALLIENPMRVLSHLVSE